MPLLGRMGCGRCELYYDARAPARQARPHKVERHGRLRVQADIDTAAHVLMSKL